MTTFELTSEELEVLREVLHREINELGVEVFRTDTHEYKEMLKRRKELLERLQAKFVAFPMAA